MLTVVVIAFLPVCARGAVSDEARLPGAELPEPERGGLQDVKYRFKFGRDLIEANLFYLIAFLPIDNVRRVLVRYVLLPARSRLCC